jgi:FlaG/FlaF family flagellin (archaellin)
MMSPVRAPNGQTIRGGMILFTPMRSRRMAEDDLAVSEVIGVVMLLAMVITMMGGVFVFLTPYVNDFQDNTAWANANGVAERLDGRIDVVAGASADTGLRTTVPSVTSSITPISSIEVWTFAADLTATESVTVTYLNQSSFSIFSYNESATNATIWTPNGEQSFSFESSHEEIIIDHDLNVLELYIVTVTDENDNPLHRQSRITISGLLIKTKVQTGEHVIALINDARYDQFSSGPWSITSAPNLKVQELFDGTMRASLSVRNVEVVGPIPDGRNAVFDISSAGPIELFSGDAWNFRFHLDSTLGPTISPQMNEGWLTDYTLHRAADTLEQHRGISPWLRASGSDGLTIDNGNTMIDLEIDLQLVEVSR